MNWHLAMDVSVAVGTWALVIATICLVRGQLSVAKQQQKIQLYLELRRDFDGTLVSARAALARQLLDGARHEDIRETVMNFFEDLGMLIRRDLVDRDMTWDTFSFLCRKLVESLYWWRASKGYVLEERRRLSDVSLFSDFESFAGNLSEQWASQRRTAVSSTEPDLNLFLRDEARIG